eukprot:3241365-Pyramimonas_sp.AAC.1
MHPASSADRCQPCAAGFSEPASLAFDASASLPYLRVVASNISSKWAPWPPSGFPRPLQM